MKYLLFGLVPLLLLVVIPLDANAERLLVTGQGEIQKRVSTSDTEFEFVFNTIPTERRTILELESGSITIGGEQHHMHPNTEIRDFMNHQILRVAGVLDNGDIFWLYGLKDGSNYELFGKLLTEENKFPLIYEGTIQSLDAPPVIVKSDPTPLVEYTPELAINFKVQDPQFIQNDLEVMLTAYDAKKGIGGLGNVVDNIPDVQIKVDLAQERREHIVVNERTSFTQVVANDWVHIASFEGKTSPQGKWTGAYLLHNLEFQHNQFIQVSITATLGEQVVTEITKVYATNAN